MRPPSSSVATKALRYATDTGVARDDLPDGGAWLYAETVLQIHQMCPGTGVEVLIPDFNADSAQLTEVFSVCPEVLAHNVEAVPRFVCAGSRPASAARSGSRSTQTCTSPDAVGGCSASG